MSRAKNILITISLTIILLVIILFVIQCVDASVNNKTYSQIDNYYTQIKDISRHNKCLTEYSYISKYSMYPNKRVPYKLLQDNYYDGVISSCRQYKTYINNINIPNSIPEDKKALLIKYKQQRSVFVDYVVKDINTAKTCKADNKCVIATNKKLMPRNFEFGKVVMQAQVTLLQSQKRLSFDYYINKYPLMLKENKSIADVTEVINNYKPNSK